MTKNIEIINVAVKLIIKAAILAAQFSGRARKRSLKRLAKMDINDKDKEIIFLRDKLNQQQMQIAILQRRTSKEKSQHTIYTPRKALHSLLYGNLSDSKMQSERISGYCQINALSLAA